MSYSPTIDYKTVPNLIVFILNWLIINVNYLKIFYKSTNNNQSFGQSHFYDIASSYLDNTRVLKLIRCYN